MRPPLVYFTVHEDIKLRDAVGAEKNLRGWDNTSIDYFTD
jgi:hypothetical protein